MFRLYPEPDAYFEPRIYLSGRVGVGPRFKPCMSQLESSIQPGITFLSSSPGLLVFVIIDLYGCIMGHSVTHHLKTKKKSIFSHIRRIHEQIWWWGEGSKLDFRRLTVSTLREGMVKKGLKGGNCTRFVTSRETKKQYLKNHDVTFDSFQNTTKGEGRGSKRYVKRDAVIECFPLRDFLANYMRINKDILNKGSSKKFVKF